jgi:hypothetical protein
VAFHARHNGGTGLSRVSIDHLVVNYDLQRGLEACWQDYASSEIHLENQPGRFRSLRALATTEVDPEPEGDADGRPAGHCFKGHCPRAIVPTWRNEAGGMINYPQMKILGSASTRC